MPEPMGNEYKDQSAGHKPYVPALCFISCALGYMTTYISRLNLTMANAQLTDPKTGILTVSQIGILGTVFTVVYALGRFLNSVIADRMKPWILLVSGLLVTGLSNMVFSLFPAYLLLAVLWGLNALGQSMLWGAILVVISTVYEPEKAKTRLTVTTASILVGNIIGILLSGWLISRFGLASAFYVPGALNVLAAVLLFLTVRKVPSFPKAPEGENPFKAAFGLLHDKTVCRQLAPVFFHGIVKDNLNLWLAAYFMVFFSVDIKASMGLVILVPLVGLAGRLLYQPIYRLLGKNEILTSLAGFAVQALAAGLILIPGIRALPAAVLLAVISAMVSIVNCSYHAVFPLRFRQRGLAASVSGLFDLFIYGGAGVGSLIFGFVIERTGTDGYLIMFAVWGAISVLSAVLLYFAYHREQKDENAEKARKKA